MKTLYLREPVSYRVPDPYKTHGDVFLLDEGEPVFLVIRTLPTVMHGAYHDQGDRITTVVVTKHGHVVAIEHDYLSEDRIVITAQDDFRTPLCSPECVAAFRATNDVTLREFSRSVWGRDTKCHQCHKVIPKPKPLGAL
jgi:hypothetical protein